MMKCSKITLVLIFMLAILTIGAVSASEDVSDENMTVSEDMEISHVDESVDDEVLEDWEDYCDYSHADEVDKNDYDREVISYYFDSDVEGSVAVLINGSEVYNSSFSQDSHWVDLYVDDLGLDSYDYGTYTMGFVYSGDDSHDGFVINTQLVLTYNDFWVSLNNDGDSNIVDYGKNIEFSIYMPEYETELNYTVNGKKYSILIDEYDPYLEISAEELQFGKNNFTFSFENDDYPLKIIEKTIEVNGLIYIEPSEVPYNGTAYVTLNLPGDANGDLNIYEVTFEWDDDELDYVPVVRTLIKTVKVENGAVNASLSNLGVGEYIFYVNYTGSDYPVSMHYRTYVNFSPIVNVPERLWINGTRDFEYRLPESYNGELYVEYGSNSHTYDVINGVATFTLSDIDSDEIELNLDYSDDEGNYFRKYIDIEVSDENPRIDLEDYVSNSTVLMGHSFYPDLTYRSSIKGTMTVYVDDELYGIFDMEDFYFFKIETEGLALGKHDVRLEYSGDDYYEPAVLLTSFNLSYIDFSVPVDVAIGNYYDYGSDSNAYIMLSPDATGEIKFIADGVEVETKSVDGNVYFNLSSLSYGNHTLTFIYQNGNYEPKTYTVDVKADYVYAFVFNDLIYGQGETALSLPIGSTGDVKILIAGKEFTSAIDENGTVKFNITGVPAGVYEAQVVYAGDAVIPAHSETFNVTVSYAIIQNFETYNIFIGNLNTSIISLTLPEDAEGNLVVSTEYWDDDSEEDVYLEVLKVKLVNGKAEISVGDIVSQTNRGWFVVRYDGGDYDIKSYDLLFEISYYEIITNYGEKLGSPFNVTVRFLESANGYMRVYDDDVIVQDNIALVNGVATITFDSSTLGSKYYKLEYVGDDYEMMESVSYDVWPEDVILLKKASGDDDLFTVKMPSDASGNLLFDYGEDEITVPYSGGVAVIKASQIPKGSYYLDNFEVNDDKYGSFSFRSTGQWWGQGFYDTFKILGTSQSVNVTKLLLEANDIEAGQDATVTVAMDNTFSGSIVINVGGVNYTVSVVNGVGSTGIPGLDEGVYLVTAYYGSLQNSATFKVISQKTDIVKTIPDELISMDDGIVILEFPSDATGSVEVFIDGVRYTVVDIINGIARIDLSKFKGGNYTFLFVYSGDDLYEGFSKDLNVTVQVKVSKITAKAASILYSSGGKYSVTVYDGDGNLANGVKITFLINGKSFKTVATNSKGVASVKITKVPGTYKITSKFLSVSVTKKLAVTHVVSLKSVKVKKSAKSLVLTATLKKVNKKYLKGKKVTFKFNGKKYTAKTNKKGVAKVTVKSSVLKKLKVGKKITYSATYSKDTVKKTVKVKK